MPAQVKGLSLGDLLQPADIQLKKQSKNPMTFADMLLHKVKGMAAPATGRIQHWLNDPVEQANASLLMGGPMGMARVWHGSPHKFNKFDMSKIGTGEGAQAYGHGLYFADNPKVAKQYQKALAPGRGIGVEDTAARVLEGVGGDAGRAIAELQRRKGMKHVQGDTDWAMKMDQAIDSIKAGKAQSNLYQVDLPDDSIAKMLDWDKPLSQQPESVRKSLGDLTEGVRWEKTSDFNPKYSLLNKNGERLLFSDKPRQGIDDMSIEQIYANFAKSKTKAEATEAFKKRGIPGIKYLDQGSRGAGEGTYNYVVFDDNIPKILEINGKPVEGDLAKSLMKRKRK